MNEWDDTDMDETRDETGTARTGPGDSTQDRVDSLSLVAGLAFVAVAFAILVERFWLDVDPVLVAGGAVAAAGIAVLVATVLRHLRGDGTPGR